ncbi:MAG: hypothetical protein ACKVOT_08745 [Polaromonas sp.]
MKNMLRTLFGRPAVQPKFKSSDPSSTLQTGSEAVNRQQLVMVTVRDVLRKSGIPSEWVDCQTLNVTSRRRGPGLYIHMVITHWDERLLRFACPFQKEVRARIERFDPKATLWVHGISWQLDLEEVCPYTTLPDKTYWNDEQLIPAAASISVTQPPSAHFPAVLAATQVTPAAGSPEHFVHTVTFQPTQPFSQSDLTQDLEKLFAIRDEEMKRARPTTPVLAGGFERTQPSPLNR